MLQLMKRNNCLTDVKLLVGKEELLAHKLVLAAASPYFKVWRWVFFVVAVVSHFGILIWPCHYFPYPSPNRKRGYWFFGPAHLWQRILLGFPVILLAIFFCFYYYIYICYPSSSTLISASKNQDVSCYFLH